MLPRKLAVTLALTCTAVFGQLLAAADVVEKTIEYKIGDDTFEGFVAYDPAIERAPGVLVVHQWMGLTDYERRRCRELAELGYVALALDIYGKGVRPSNPQEAGQMAGKFKSDRDLFRKRLEAGFEQLKKQPQVNPEQTAAIGYCFGGTGVLELARSGADVKGVVSFHGGLDSPNPQDGESISSKILVCHGADDPFVPAADIEAFKAELNAADVDWQMIYYSNAVHSFTQPMAGDDNSRGAAYNEKADRRSWLAMQQFFNELFGTSGLQKR